MVSLYALVPPTRFMFWAIRTTALTGCMGRGRNDTPVLALVDVIKTIVSAIAGGTR